ncbi:MAG: glycosyltransferase [Oscillatoriales cyanobacterium C42_A2020_001]|nr:glycosyltransferase [Leptolyngbyaceae cyanobacterium C42_A2020_001]
MKIAFIVEAFPVLSQTFVLNQITGLIDRGHEVDIYAEFLGDTQKIHPDVVQYQLLERTYYQPKVPTNKLKRVMQALWLVVLYLFRDPILVLRSLNLFKYGKQAASLRIFYSAIPFLGNRRNYDIIQCHFGLLGIKGLFLKEIGAINGKLITAFHGVDISQNLKLFGETVYDDLLQTGDHFLPISKHWQKRLIELGCNPDKITVHRMGIDCQRFTFLPRSLAPGETVRLISVARLTEKKGIEFGIRAVAKVLQSHPNLEYVIVGDGELRTELTELIASLKIADQVKLLGWRNQSEVVELLHQSHILLAPSVTAADGNQEGIPVALMEAMAMGLPVITTYHSGIPELVEDGISGFLVPERDVEALAEKLSFVLQQSDRWVEIEQAGRSKVEQEFAINLLNDRLVQLYQSFIQPGQRHLRAEKGNGKVSDRAPLDAHPTPMNS